MIMLQYQTSPKMKLSSPGMKLNTLKMKLSSPKLKLNSPKMKLDNNLGEKFQNRGVFGFKSQNKGKYNSFRL